MRKPILFFFFLGASFFAQSQSKQEGKLYAVVVGISEYKKPWRSLQYCHTDAIEMSKLLAKQTSISNVKLLKNKDATVSNILKVTTEIFTKTNPQDIVILYFSGHGGVGHFLAHDGALYFHSLSSIFSNTKAKRKIIFADACYSGAFRIKSSTVTSNDGGIGDKVLLFLSSRSDQISYEPSTLKNGMFTYYLMEGLKGAADTDNDRIITAKELFAFVTPRVKKYMKGYGITQAPLMLGNFSDNLVVFNWQKRIDPRRISRTPNVR
ncbi:hypothetical protein FACS1894199_05310 [Bacteroidia bacterium]|nr:hypothetical protein FACS1894199_05310 [Bacteroidia bacterium]